MDSFSYQGNSSELQPEYGDRERVSLLLCHRAK